MCRNTSVLILATCSGAGSVEKDLFRFFRFSTGFLLERTYEDREKYCSPAVSAQPRQAFKGCQIQRVVSDDVYERTELEQVFNRNKVNVN